MVKIVYDGIIIDEEVRNSPALLQPHHCAYLTEAYAPLSCSIYPPCNSTCNLTDCTTHRLPTISVMYRIVCTALVYGAMRGVESVDLFMLLSRTTHD
jgi:hypothetical protein